MSVELQNSVRPGWIEIDLGALQNNYMQLRNLVGATVNIIPALKGNAYGHGVELVSKALNSTDAYALAVGSFNDAEAIRKAGVAKPIVMFAGPLPEAFGPILENDLIPTVHNMGTAHVISRLAARPTQVFIKVDTGLGRLGFPVEIAHQAIREVIGLPNISVLGIYTHLTFYSEAEMQKAKYAVQAFDELLDQLAKDGIEIPLTQALASTGLLTGFISAANSVCPGSLLYGMCPVDPELCDFSSFQPVLRAVKTRLIQVNARPNTGIVPMGVADGLRPMAQIEAIIRGQKVKVAGISLEYANIDLSPLDSVEVGDEVIFVGGAGAEEITLDHLASCWQTAPLHALMGFSSHIPRIPV